MSTDLAKVLREATTYLKKYVVATRSKISEVKKLEDVLVENLPAEALEESLEGSKPLYVVVRYCLDLIRRIHQAGARLLSTSKDTTGSMDAQAVDMMVEIIFSVSLRPFLTEGLGTHLPKDPAMSGVGKAMICSRTEIDSILQGLVLCLSDTSHPTLVTASLKKSLHLSLLTAGVIESTYNPSYVSGSLDMYDKLINSLEPRSVLTTMQMLYTRRCPVWARSIIGEEMTKVLLGPDGLKHVSAFILQPDKQGEIPIERFDHLSSLVASVPASMSTTDYMRVLIPQIFDAFEDTSSVGALRRQAMSHIVKRLFDVHSESSILADALWKPVVDRELPSDESVASALKRLSTMTSYPALRVPILNSRATNMLTAGYKYHLGHETSNRDMVERLIYRSTENNGQADLPIALENFMHRTNLTSSSNQSRATSLRDCSPHDYFCRVLDQIKGDGALIDSLLRSLLQRFLVSTDPAVQIIRVQWLMELPEKYASLIFTPVHTPVWIKDITAMLSESTKDHQIIVLLGLLKCLVEAKPEFRSGDEPALDNLMTCMSKLQKRFKNSKIGETTNAIGQKLELMLLTLRAGAVQLSTSHSLSNREEAQKKYMAALQDMGDDMIPNRAHGLYLIGEIATSKDQSIIDLSQLSPIILGLLAEEEPFVHHNAIKVMRKLLSVYKAQYETMLAAALQDTRYSKDTKDRISVVLED